MGLQITRTSAFLLLLISFGGCGVTEPNHHQVDIENELATDAPADVLTAQTVNGTSKPFGPFKETTQNASAILRVTSTGTNVRLRCVVTANLHQNDSLVKAVIRVNDRPVSASQEIGGTGIQRASAGINLQLEPGGYKVVCVNDNRYGDSRSSVLSGSLDR